ncbi:MAG: dTDP-4-dehydrorhamnose 3,5-epimerase [Alphaproteobacteria bacterium]
MRIVETAIPEVKLVLPERRGDARGFFSEVYRRDAFAAAGIPDDFVQDNHSFSATVGTIRGLHFQTDPHAQGKLVRVARGAIVDVAVDVRRGSPTYGRHVAVTISAAEWNQLWIPAGFAHGFCTIEPDTEVLYKVTSYYAPACDKGVRWDDPEIGIDWPVDAAMAVLSDKDRRQPLLADLPAYFTYRAEAA